MRWTFGCNWDEEVYLYLQNLDVHMKKRIVKGTVT